MNKILIDTNVILDVLFMRPDFYQDSNSVLQLCENNKIKGYVTSSVLMDVRYFAYKFTHDKHIANKAIKELVKFLEVLEINGSDIFNACDDLLSDFEDSVIENCANRNKINYIITRNVKHFENKKAKVVSPSCYLSKQKDA